jgi:MFS family permease
MCSDVGAIVGPLVAGLLADRVSYPVAFGVGVLLILGAALSALRMPPGIAVATASVQQPTGAASKLR